jgi:hypothetical protein
MQTFTITSRPARIGWTAAGIWVLSVVVLGMLVGGQWLMHNGRPDTLDWILLPALPTCLAVGWLLNVRYSTGQRARQLTAYEWGISIERFDGRIVNLAWNEIRAIEYNSLDDDVLALQTADARVVVLGHAFSHDDWMEWACLVGDHVPEHAEFRDTQTSFEGTLTTWLDRASLGFVLVGGAATIALLIWDPRNAAAWIVLFGTLAALIFLGNQAIDLEEGNVPIAKVLGFFSSKMLAIVPLAMIVIGLVQPAGFKLPAHKHVVLFYVSNLMFFGGMAGALVVRGGFSPEQYYRSMLEGVNRYHRHAFVVALAICIAGFMLKAWNER